MRDPTRCPKCQARYVRELEIRLLKGARRRRYACPHGHRWSTYELTISPRQLRPSPSTTTL